MFPAAITANFPRYYQKEIDGKAYKNIIVRRSTSVFGNDVVVDNENDLTVKLSDHFSVVDPSEKLIKETDGTLHLVKLGHTNFLLSEFTYQYYFGVDRSRYSSVIVIFIQRDIFGKHTITIKKCNGKYELFEIACGLDIGGSVRNFLGNNMDLFDINDDSIIDIKQVGHTSRIFERRLIGYPTEIHTTICLATHLVDMINHDYNATSHNTAQISKKWFKENGFRDNFGSVTQQFIMDLFGIKSKSSLDSIKRLESLTHYYAI